jgi:RimJ/RimL family protein N-acetyltransferase
MAGSVHIRLYQAADVAEMTAAARESVADVSPWMPWCHTDYSEADAAAWITATLDGHRSGAMYDFAIGDDVGRYAGGCGINQISRLSGVANLGYWVRSSATGRGIAAAAVLQLIPWVFQNTSLHRLESRLLDSPASQAALALGTPRLLAPATQPAPNTAETPSPSNTFRMATS